MRLATCLFDGVAHPAIVRGDEVSLMSPRADGVLGLLEGRLGEAAVRTIVISEAVFMPPIPNPGKIICVGINYRDHAAEAGAEPAPHPSLFPRFADTVVGHRQAVLAPRSSQQFDYEGELAVIIGAETWHVDADAALDHVAGYACFAENSVRDYQFHARQVTAGKNFFASGSFGPFITTRDEAGDPAMLELITRLNGEEVQHAPISDLIFDVPALIAYISSFARLMPGDVIATGTPAGVGGARKPPLWLKPGDTLEVEIAGVGLLVNPVIAEAEFYGARASAEI